MSHLIYLGYTWDVLACLQPACHHHKVGRFGRFEVEGKMVQIEEMTECSLGNEMDETDGAECTIDEGTMTERNSSLPGYLESLYCRQTGLPANQREGDLTGIDHMIGEGTRKGRGSSFREGEGLADSLEKARPVYSSGKLGDEACLMTKGREDMGHFSSRLEDETKIKRTGYNWVLLKLSSYIAPYGLLNSELQISRRLRCRDFITKQQIGIWIG